MELLQSQYLGGYRVGPVRNADVEHILGLLFPVELLGDVDPSQGRVNGEFVAVVAA